MDASYAALQVLCLLAFGALPSSANLMYDGFNEPSGHYRSTRRPPYGSWLEGPAEPSTSEHYHQTYMTGHGPHGPLYRPHHGPHGPHGPHPGNGARTPGGSFSFPSGPSWTTTTRNPPPGMPGHKHSPSWKPSRGTARPTIEPPLTTGEQNQIPLSLFNRLNEVNDIEDFFRLVEGGDNRPDEESEGGIVNRFGEIDTSVQRKPSSPFAKPAHCIPENQTVALRVPNADPSVIYYPTCTRIPRCGGCCAGNIQSCQPTEMSTINVKVIMTTYAGGSKLKNAQETLIAVEQHTKCGCQCIIKEKDCGPMQRYIPGECRCECINRDDRAKCQLGADRLWDNSTCACICRHERTCSTGRLFSPRTCECERLPERRRRTNQQETSTQPEPDEEDNVWT